MIDPDVEDLRRTRHVPRASRRYRSSFMASRRTLRAPAWVVVGALFLIAALEQPAAAAVQSCGPSLDATICVIAASDTLVGPATITLTSTVKRSLELTWIAGSTSRHLIELFASVPGSNPPAYSFVWPTQQYLDAAGTIQVRACQSNDCVVMGAPVSLTLTLANGNLVDTQHTPADWATPQPWAGTTDPVIPAVGDGPDGQNDAKKISSRIAAQHPPLFLFLGDVYQHGSPSEYLNYYGQSALDGAGTLWGALAGVTQPTIGNHEYELGVPAGPAAFGDYWHQRPLYTSFRFANTLFLDLDANTTFNSMAVGSPQYNYVQGVLTDQANPPPPCIIAFFHEPTVNDKGNVSSETAMWRLLVDNGTDLVLNGHLHSMAETVPMNSLLGVAQPGQNAAVELISGAGGHGVGAGITTEPRFQWAQGHTPGWVNVTLVGANNGGTPGSLTWSFVEGKDAKGTVLRTGSRSCGVPLPPPSPTISGFNPTHGVTGDPVTISGSNFTGATSVKFNGTAAAFSITNDSTIAATVPPAAMTGPINVTTAGGTATSSTDFTVDSTSPLSPTMLQHVLARGGGGTDLEATWSGPTQDGDLLVASIGWSGSGTPTAPPGWTLAVKQGGAAIFYSENAPASSGTVLFGGGAGITAWVVDLMEWSGMLPAGALDGTGSDSSGAQSTGTAHSGVTPSTTQPSGIAVVAIRTLSAATLSNPSNGFTIVDVGTQGGTTTGGFAKILQISGIQETFVALTPVARWRGVIATFRGA